MTTPAAENLEPIDVVARRLGLRASAIRYYEERGLLTPASRHAWAALVRADRDPPGGDHPVLAALWADEP